MNFLPKVINFIKKHKWLIISILVIIGYIIWRLYGARNSYNFETIKEVDSIITKHFPPIKKYENLFTYDECQQIIKLGESRLERSLMGVAEDKGVARTSWQAWLHPEELPCLARASNFVAKVTGLPVENQEKWQLLHYLPGQEYQAHYDACSPLTDEYQACMEDDDKRGWGKRVYTFFIYLNDVPEGGETHFPRLNISVKPKQGSAILWENLTKDRTKTHEYSQHAGMPVKKGEKWAINVWIRERPESLF